jgi:hypothetical protein
MHRLHGKGPAYYNMRGKFYDSPGWSWGVGGQGWVDQVNVYWQVMKVYRFQAQTYGNGPSITWRLPVFRREGTTIGTSMGWNNWEFHMSQQMFDNWPRFLKLAGLWHPWCLGAWQGRCGPAPPFIKTRTHTWTQPR